MRATTGAVQGPSTRGLIRICAAPHCAAVRGPARIAAIVAIALIQCGAFPGVSAAATTFGDSLGVPGSIIQAFPGCGRPCTLATTVSPERLAQFRAPLTGTIVRWRIQTVAGSAAQRIALRVLAPVAGDTFGPAPREAFTGAGTSRAVPAPTKAGTFTFPTRLPVRAGEFIGLDTEGGALAAVAVEEESIRVFTPPPLDFRAARAGAHENYALLINADVVPRVHHHRPRHRRRPVKP
jgi:hypothetical protein